MGLNRIQNNFFLQKKNVCDFISFLESQQVIPKKQAIIKDE